MSLEKLTIELYRLLKELRQRFENSEPPESLRDHAFFNMMKSETEPVYNLLQEWETKSLLFVKEKKLRIHPHQVVSTAENYHLLLMHSYYIDVREKRYMELYYSITYIFDILLEDLRKNEKE